MIVTNFYQLEEGGGINGQLAKWIRQYDKRPWINPVTLPTTPNKNRPTSGHGASRLAVLIINCIIYKANEQKKERQVAQ